MIPAVLVAVSIGARDGMGEVLLVRQNPVSNVRRNHEGSKSLLSTYEEVKMLGLNECVQKEEEEVNTAWARKRDAAAAMVLHFVRVGRDCQFLHFSHHYPIEFRS